MSNISDTEADRLAVRAFAYRFANVGLDMETVPFNMVEQAWAAVVGHLLNAPDDRFEAITAEAVEKSQGNNEAQKRVRSLIADLQIGRAELWEAAEIKAGRDPHQIVET